MSVTYRISPMIQSVIRAQAEKMNLNAIEKEMVTAFIITMNEGRLEALVNILDKALEVDEIGDDAYEFLHKSFHHITKYLV